MTTSPPPSSRSSRWCPQESQKSCHAPVALRRASPVHGLARLLLAFDLEERERAHRLALAARTQRAEGLADLAVLDRAVHRDQHVERMVAERRREGELLLRRGHRVARRWARRTRRPDAAPAYRSRRGGRRRWPRRSAPASTSRATARRGSRERNAARSLPSMAAGSASQNMNAPDTAHSPGSAARSNTKVSDGSSRMVRRSFMCAALRLSGSSHDTARQRADERTPHRLGRAHAPHQQIAVLVDVGGRTSRCSGDSRAR